MLERASLDELHAARLSLAPEHSGFVYCYPPLWRVAQSIVSEGVRDAAIADLDGPISVYVHVPFCEQICSFCSLHKIRAARHDPVVQAYLSAVRAELRSYASVLQGGRLHSVYFGGGTPSLLSTDELDSLLDALADTGLAIGVGTEVCVEMTPELQEDLGRFEEKLSRLAKRETLPLTRVSIGLQAGDDRTLGLMNRLWSTSDIRRSIEAIDRIAPSYNVDFIYGDSNTAESCVTEVETRLQFLESIHGHGLRVPAVSFYRVWASTWLPASQLRAPPFEETDILAATRQLGEGLGRLGYRPSTVSNFVRDRRDRHMATVHRLSGGTVLGIGSGAYSLLPGAILARTRSIDRYVAAVTGGGFRRAVDFAYPLTRREQAVRKLVLGVKLAEGIVVSDDAWASMEEHGSTARDALQILEELGLITLDGQLVRLTADGVLLGNEISMRLHEAGSMKAATR